MTILATIDLKNIHEIYEQIKVDYPEYSERFVYCLAASHYLEPDMNLEIVLKLRPYGGLVGIDNSSLDTYLKSYKFLRLHAILHDASGFIAEHSQKGPGFSYVLPCPITNSYIGHMTGLTFCLFVKMFKRKSYSYHHCHTIHFPLVRGNLISGLVGSYTVYLGALAVILTGFYPKSLSQLNFVFHPESFMQKEKRNRNHCKLYCRRKL